MEVLEGVMRPDAKAWICSDSQSNQGPEKNICYGEDNRIFCGETRLSVGYDKVSCEKASEKAEPENRADSGSTMNTSEFVDFGQ